MIPPSTKEGVDDAVYGVAIWDNVDFDADSFKVFVRGLSDGYQDRPASGGRQALHPLQGPPDRLPESRRRPEAERAGDPPGDPPYDWVYYP